MMNKMNRFFTGSMTACIVCLASAASYTQSPPTTEITAGRAQALAAAAVGLISLIVGALAWARAAGRLGTGNGRASAVVALLIGALGVVLSAVHLATSTGGFGTGSGRAGAIVALVLSLVGVSFGWLARARFRRSHSTA